MAALSDSRVTSGVSTAMRSPGFTSTSMTATSLKLPKSGTRTSTRPPAAFIRTRTSDLPGHGLGGIDAERLDGAAHGRLIHACIVGKRLERRHGDVVAVDLEVPAQRRARIRASESVGAERDITAADPLADLVRHRTHVVGGRDHRTLAALQHLPYVRNTRGLPGMQPVPAFAFERFAAQFTEARHRQHIRRYAVVVLEDLRRRQTFAQDGAGTEQGRAHLAAAADLQQVAAAQDPRFHARWHGRLRVVLVHHRDVVEDALL